MSKTKGFAHLADAGALLPFAKEPDARTEITWTWAGEKPLRIYKNDYDRHPPMTIPKMNCVKMFDAPT